MPPAYLCMGCSRRELSPTIDALTLINPVAVTERQFKQTEGVRKKTRPNNRRGAELCLTIYALTLINPVTVPELQFKLEGVKHTT